MTSNDASSSHACAAPESPLRTCVHWPLKLRLAPVDDPMLSGAELCICGDCTAFASKGFHEQAGRGKTLLIGCPKFEEPRLLKAKTVELFQAVRPTGCSVIRMEKPCCKGLTTICVEAAKECGLPFEVEETIVCCSGELEFAGPQPPRKE